MENQLKGKRLETWNKWVERDKREGTPYFNANPRMYEWLLHRQEYEEVLDRMAEERQRH